MRSASTPSTPRPVRIRSSGAAVADQPREPDGATVHQRHTPTAAVHAERRVVRRHPEVGPAREFQASCHRVALDGGDHRLGELQAGRTHRSERPDDLLRCDVEHRVAAAVGDRREVGAGAERAVGAGQDGDRDRVVTVEVDEHVVEQLCGRPVDGVAHLGPVDGDDANGATILDSNRHRPSLARPASDRPRPFALHFRWPAPPRSVTQT